MRYDQFMRLGWKFLVPISLGWLLLVAGFRAYRQKYGVDAALVRNIAIVFFVVLLVTAFLPERKNDDDSVDIAGSDERRVLEEEGSRRG
jgi:NADH-quinone oxidoreductase subunit H